MESRTRQQAANENEKKTLYEIYTNYIDPSEITLQHYLKRKFHSGQEQYFHKLNKWLQHSEESNKPLILKAKPGTGIKTIFSHWHNQISMSNANKKEKNLSIIHYASNGSNNQNYFYCLYRIIIKLKEALKLKQNVDLLEQKIRKYFAYWLDISNSQVQRQKVIYCSQQIYNKIIIIIEGVDKFLDPETGKQANIAFWLPKTFPKNIKVVCSVSQNSQAYDHFQKNSCQIINLQICDRLVNEMYKQGINCDTSLKSQTQTLIKNKLTSLYQKKKNNPEVYKIIDTYCAFFLPQKNCKEKSAKIIKQILETKLKKQTIMKIQNLNDINKLIIDLWEENFPGKKLLKQALIYLALSQKGITLDQILLLTQFSETQWELVCSIFKYFIVSYENINSIKCKSFIQALLLKEKDQDILKFHEKIAESLETTPNSIRKLEEQTYHLFISQSYFKLKEIVSNIQNFLLLFNQHNKYQLSRYWQKLQEKGFDPVIQYNKAVEGFSMHYHPSDENIFRIIVQISKFLKEFCDFQTYKTPHFRHPFIEGNMAELQKIGLLKEFATLDIYVDNSFNSPQESQKIFDCSLEEQIKNIREKHFPKNAEIQNLSHVVENISGKVAEIENEINIKIRKKANMKILSEIQQLNVDVPMNREKFRKFYIQNLQEFLQKQELQQLKNEPAFFQIEEESQPSTHSHTYHQDYSFSKVRENYRMRKIKPSLYYYKRWIWIQFPWVCISLNNNYSNTPQLCRSLESDDIDSNEQQSKYTKQALIVAIEAKQKKKQMFNKKNQNVGLYSSGFTRANKSNIMATTLSVGSRFKDKSVIRSRVVNKNPNSIDLSLNSLTKELELRKKDIDIENTQKDQFFLSEIQESYQEDMKFIKERKHFEIPQIKGMSSDQILPKLKWTIKEHTAYQINYIKEHIEEKRKKLNKIIYTNKKLGQTYKELKMKENLTKKTLHEQEQEKNSRKNKIIDELTQKKEEVINEFCKSLLQQERLKIVLKLCSENKTRNQEYLASLNYFLQSLKKMINWEKENIKSITKEMNGIKVMKEKQQMMEAQKQRNQQILEKQAHKYLEEKKKIQEQIENISLVIQEDINTHKNRLENSLTGHIKNKQEKDIMILQEKKTKQLEEKLMTLEEQYEAIQKLFDIDDMNFQKSEKFKHLLQENQKNKKLKILYFQQKNKLENAQKNLEETKNKYISYKQANLMSKKVTAQVPKNEDRKREELNDKLENNLKIFLDNIMLKLGINKMNDILPCLKSKLEDLRTNNVIKYTEIMSIQKQNQEPF